MPVEGERSTRSFSSRLLCVAGNSSPYKHQCRSPVDLACMARWNFKPQSSFGAQNSATSRRSVGSTLSRSVVSASAASALNTANAREPSE